MRHTKDAHNIFVSLSIFFTLGWGGEEAEKDRQSAFAPPSSPAEPGRCPRSAISSEK
jgi:hypothetical protein